ncbi:redoxin family protein [Phenylobacterium sp.]|uniref:redoxin family protein n=1 Tax=Phenylobacterium sp. TaxID=1871053 RepID=UPI00286D4B29|nr:redoxin family protein [Phenylobacterium sp.]
MLSARIGVLGLLASAALVYGCSTNGAQSALDHAQVAAGAEAMAAPTPATIDNFMLVDAQKLEAHDLYRMADDKAIVLVSTGVGCPIARSMVPALKALRDRYAAQGVEMFLVDSNLQDSRDAIAAEAKEYGIDIPILMDSNQLVGEALGVTRTAEVFVITPKTWKVAYHGPVSDAADYGVQKAATKEFANDALAAVLAGKPAPAATQASKGCLVDFPERGKAAATRISYVKDVAPILEAKCVACHEEGGIGPFAMTNYAMVKGFSPMIREVIRTDRMPPYNADPHVGKFSDDKSLTPKEIKTIVHWVEAGAPRGDGVDPLGAKKHVAPEWPLGKPDLVLNVPAYTIPASGVVDYQHPYAINPLTEGKWLRASTIKVESRQGVHHILTGYMTEVPKPGQAFENKWGVSVGGYAVGAESEIAPKNVGAYLPPGGAVGFQTHYTPFGKEVTDHSQVALYFYKANEKPEMVMHNSVIVNNSIVLPPNDGHHLETTYLNIPHEMLLYSAFPHAHYRGASADLWLRTPDGKDRLLLSLPRYDFSWQRAYTFAEPVKVPAGSKLIAHFIYDNSKRNPNNPDPNKTVVWGDQSWEEMFYTALRYRWIGETSAKMNDFDKDLDQDRILGMLDQNIDGKIQKAELKGQMGDMIAKYFDVLDKNHDGALDKDELAAMQKMMGGQRRKREASAETPKAPASTAPPAATRGGK